MSFNLQNAYEQVTATPSIFSPFHSPEPEPIEEIIDAPYIRLPDFLETIAIQPLFYVVQRDYTDVKPVQAALHRLHHLASTYSKMRDRRTNLLQELEEIEDYLNVDITMPQPVYEQILANGFRADLFQQRTVEHAI